MGSSAVRRDPWPWVALASGLAFLVLATVVARRGGLPGDGPIADAIRRLPIPIGFWQACTFLGGAVLIPIGVTFVLVAAVGRRPRLALIVAITLLVATFFTDAIKDYVARPRPPDPIVPATGYGFPSGHTLNSTATYGLLALVTWRARLRASVRRLAVVAGIVLPALIGLSRIALGVHWPSDVVGGWLLGTMLVALAATSITRTGAMVPLRAVRGPAEPASG
jgi:membrane-associated phospholipid phosphatase